MNPKEEIDRLFYQSLNKLVPPKGFCPYCRISIASQEPTLYGHHHDCWRKKGKVKQAKKAMLQIFELASDRCDLNCCKKEIVDLKRFSRAQELAKKILESLIYGFQKIKNFADSLAKLVKRLSKALNLNLSFLRERASA